MKFTEQQLKNAIAEIKTDKRWKKKWSERFGDAYYPFYKAYGEEAWGWGLGYKFPFGRTLRGKIKNECDSEGWFLAIQVNGIGQNIRLFNDHRWDLEKFDFAEIADAIRQFTTIKKD